MQIRGGIGCYLHSIVNLFNIFIDIIIFAGLIYMSVNHIDKKLDII